MHRNRRLVPRAGTALLLALVGLFWSESTVWGKLLPENFPVPVIVNQAVRSQSVTLTNPKKEAQVLYRVKAGDTLWQIAKRYRADWLALAKAGCLDDCNNIKIGQVLRIPAETSFDLDSAGDLPPILYSWPVVGRITSHYGGRHDEFHHGLDIAAPLGTPIRAVAKGQVAYAGWRPIYGQTVIINHDDGRKTLYAHASRILVRKGQAVAAGKVIAEIGSTGRSTGPHLHFEIYEQGRTVDPLSRLIQ